MVTNLTPEQLAAELERRADASDVDANAASAANRRAVCLASSAAYREAAALVRTNTDPRIERMREGLEWYREIAEAANRYMTSDPPKTDGITALLTELSLDCGKRARAALEE